MTEGCEYGEGTSPYHKKRRACPFAGWPFVGLENGNAKVLLINYLPKNVAKCHRLNCVKPLFVNYLPQITALIFG